METWEREPETAAVSRVSERGVVPGTARDCLGLVLPYLGILWLVTGSGPLLPSCPSVTACYEGSHLKPVSDFCPL